MLTSDQEFKIANRLVDILQMMLLKSSNSKEITEQVATKLHKIPEDKILTNEEDDQLHESVLSHLDIINILDDNAINNE